VGQIKQNLPKIQVFRRHRKNLAGGQKKVPEERKCKFYDSLFRFVGGTCKQNRAFLAPCGKVPCTQMPVVILLIIFAVTI
jgi:hypothetical protein